MTPIAPALDLAAGGDLLAATPRCTSGNAPADQSYLDIGARLMPIILETQKVTLAGFRIPRSSRIVVRRPR